MDILVSPNSTKSEVMNLARHLRKKHIEGGFVIIFIFDLKEAWANRDNDKYPQDKYFRHFLASVFVNPNTGYDEITWVAEGRAH